MLVFKMRQEIQLFFLGSKNWKLLHLEIENVDKNIKLIMQFSERNVMLHLIRKYKYAKKNYAKSSKTF